MKNYDNCTLDTFEVAIGPNDGISQAKRSDSFSFVERVRDKALKTAEFQKFTQLWSLKVRLFVVPDPDQTGSEVCSSTRSLCS